MLYTLAPLALSLLLSRPVAAQDVADLKDVSRAWPPAAAAAADATTGERWALIVGVDTYEDPDIVDLRVSDDDARTVAATLVESGAWRSDHIVVMTPDQADPALRPTRAQLWEQVERLVRQDDAAMILFYFSGHGASIETDGARRNLLFPMDASDTVIEQSSVALDELVAALDRSSAAGRVVVFDACRSALYRSAKALPAAWSSPNYALSRGTQVLYGSEFGTPSLEGDTLSVFTSYLVRGLRGEADAQPADEVVGIDELYRWTDQAMRADPRVAQRPTHAGEWAGEIALAPVRPLPPSKLGSVPESTDRAEIVARADLALAAADPLQFRAEREALRRALAVTSDPLRAEDATRVHLVEARSALLLRDEGLAEAALLGALRSDPQGARAALERLPDLPPPPAIPETDSVGHVSETRGYVLRVDGRRDDWLPTDRPAVVQAEVRCQGMAWSVYALPGQALPTMPRVTCDHAGLSRGLGVTAGGLGLAAAGLAVGDVFAYKSYLTYKDAFDDSAHHSAADVQRGQQKETLARALGFAAGAAGGAALITGGVSIALVW